VHQLILDCSGIYIELTNKFPELYPNDSIRIKVNAIIRSNIKCQIDGIYFWGTDSNNVSLNKSPILLTKNINYINSFTEEIIRDDFSFSVPYTVYNDKLEILKNASYKENKFYNDKSIEIYQPEFREDMRVILDLSIEGEYIQYSQVLQYKKIDPSFGEIFQPVIFSPEITTHLESDLYIGKRSHTLDLNIILNTNINLSNKEEEFNYPVYFKMTPKKLSLNNGAINGKYLFSTKLTSLNKFAGNTIFGMNFPDFNEIKYDHIPTQKYFKLASSKILINEFSKNAKKIAYISGAGDKIPEILSQIGYDVTLLDEKNISSFELKNFDVIVTGIRAFNTEKWLTDYNSKFLKYVEEGGNLLIQYNTTNGLVAEIPKPFPFKISRDRITEEESDVIILDSTVSILNFPNKIRNEDFKNWVQEFGLYFPTEMDSNYKKLFSMHDTGESPNENSTIYCQFGKGKYVYTGLSFFRELPAGVPGAIKLFINLMEDNEEIKKEEIKNEESKKEKRKNK
jgi:hypothetical protein